MFKQGYDVADFTADVNKFGAKNDIKALKRALKNSTILGRPVRRRLRHDRVPASRAPTRRSPSVSVAW